MTAAAHRDAELVQASRRGDLAAFGQLVERHKSLVFAICLAASGDRGEAEDSAQEVFLAAWRTLDRLRDPEKLRPWLCGIARNVAAKTRRRKRHESLSATDLPESQAMSDPLEALIDRETEARVQDALQAMPEAYREPLVLFYQEARSVSDVAAALGLSVDAVKQRLTRGRRLLRKGVGEASFAAVVRRAVPGGFTVAVLASISSASNVAHAATARSVVKSKAFEGAVMTSTKTKITIATAVVAATLGFVAWTQRTTEAASEAEAEAPTSPARAAPRSPKRTVDRSSSEANPSETPAEVVPTKRDRSPAQGCALAFGEAPDCAFLEPDEETLLEMARCGIARLDAPLPPRPGSGLGVFPKDWLEKAGVGEAEQQRLEQAAAAYMAQQRERWADLAITVGIERDWAETTAPAVIVGRIVAEFEVDQVAAAVERVARERAGLTPNDADVPATLDAAVRLRLDTGDAFEVAIAEAVGEARAAELRAVADGWPGAHTYMGNSCDRDPIPPPERRVVPSTAAEAQACVADPKGQHCSFLDPNQLELDRMAECGIVRFNIPHFMQDRYTEPTFGQGWGDAVGLTLQEAAVLAEVGEEYREALYRQLTELVLAAGKSKEWADQASFLAMVFALGEASPLSPAEAEAMYRRLAAEKAGHVAPPTDLSGLSLEERFARIEIEIGDEFERALAARLGPDRTHEIRHANDGWPGPRVQGQNFCDGSQHQLL